MILAHNEAQCLLCAECITIGKYSSCRLRTKSQSPASREGTIAAGVTIWNFWEFTNLFSCLRSKITLHHLSFFSMTKYFA